MPSPNYDYYITPAPTVSDMIATWLTDHPDHAVTRYGGNTLRVARCNVGEHPYAPFSVLISGGENSGQPVIHYQGVWTDGNSHDMTAVIQWAEMWVGARNGSVGSPLQEVETFVSGTVFDYGDRLVWEWMGSNAAIHRSFVPYVRFFRAPEYVQEFTCVGCMQRRPISQRQQCTTCHNRYCVSCYSAHSHTSVICYDCGFGILTGQSAAGFCDDCDGYFCSSHSEYHNHDYEPDYDEPSLYDEPSRAQPRFQGHGREASLNYLDQKYKPHEIVRSERAATVELEVEYNGTGSLSNAVRLPAECGIGTDGSLNNGMEITLPPAKGAVLADYMIRTCKILKEAGYGVEETCGMHTHIDMRDKVQDNRYLAHLFNALYAFEDVLFAMQGEPRHGNDYSIPLRQMYKFYEMYGQEVDSFDFNFYKQEKNSEGQRYLNNEKAHKYASPRYASFNFHSMYFRGSLECRIHEGCVDAEEALMWIELLQRIIARVESGHSYAVMRKMVEMKVTKQKVSAFNRYFKIPHDMRGWINDRITAGQGFGFDLGSFEWGQPKMGRARKVEVPDRNVPHLNQEVGCQRCGHQFRMRRNVERCPNCRRYLFGDYGDVYYSVIMPEPPLPALMSPLQASQWNEVNSLNLNGYGHYISSLDLPEI